MPRKGTSKTSVHRKSVTEKFASPKFGKQKQKAEQEAGKKKK